MPRSPFDSVDPEIVDYLRLKGVEIAPMDASRTQGFEQGALYIQVKGVTLSAAQRIASEVRANVVLGEADSYWKADHASEAVRV